jgi:hypothetical protein
MSDVATRSVKVALALEAGSKSQNSHLVPPVARPEEEGAGASAPSLPPPSVA